MSNVNKTKHRREISGYLVFIKQIFNFVNVECHSDLRNFLVFIFTTEKSK